MNKPIGFISYTSGCVAIYLQAWEPRFFLDRRLEFYFNVRGALRRGWFNRIRATPEESSQEVSVCFEYVHEDFSVSSIGRSKFEFIPRCTSDNAERDARLYAGRLQLTVQNYFLAQYSDAPDYQAELAYAFSAPVATELPLFSYLARVDEVNRSAECRWPGDSS